MSLFPLNYTLYLIFKELAIIGECTNFIHNRGYQSLTQFILLKIN